MRFLLLAALALSACSPVYKLAISQGNVIDDEKLAQLETGMTPEQVRFLLGSPLVTNEFEPERWDYVAYYRGPDDKERRRTLTLHFDDGVLASYDEWQPAGEPVFKPGENEIPDQPVAPDDEDSVLPENIPEMPEDV